MPDVTPEATPGQAAHDGWWDALPHRRDHPDYAPYERESAEDRRAWDASAAAVLALPCPGCESLRRQCSELAGELGACKAGNAEYGERLASLRRQLDSAAATMFPRLRSEIASLEERLRQAEADLAESRSESEGYGLRMDRLRVALAGVMENAGDEHSDPVVYVRHLEDELARAGDACMTVTRERDAVHRERNRYVEMTIRRGQGLVDIRARLPLGRHAAPDECAEIDRIAIEALKVAGAEEVADGVRVDWDMTPAEWAQLSGVLRQHEDVPYIAALIAAGKIPGGPVHVPDDGEYPDRGAMETGF